MAPTKRGQVSLEFLTTYGWAFLVVLIVIGGMAYFGILSPGKFTGKRCQLGREVGCPGFAIMLDEATDEPVIKTRVTNNLPSRIILTNITFSNREKVKLSGCQIISPSPFPPVGDDGVTIMEGEGADFISRCTADTGNFDIGDKQKIDVVVSYYLKKSGPEYEKTVSGDMYDEVQTYTP